MHQKQGADAELKLGSTLPQTGYRILNRFSAKRGDNVEGTVTLYAVIHTDGTVSGIKVLNSIDPVEREALVQIPFRKHHPRYRP